MSNVVNAFNSSFFGSTEGYTSDSIRGEVSVVEITKENLVKAREVIKLNLDGSVYMPVVEYSSDGTSTTQNCGFKLVSRKEDLVGLYLGVWYSIRTPEGMLIILNKENLDALFPKKKL